MRPWRRGGMPVPVAALLTIALAALVAWAFAGYLSEDALFALLSAVTFCG